MNKVYCTRETSLTEEEKAVFAGHLAQEELSDNVWDLFEEWLERSTSKVQFFYLRVYGQDELIGLGLFLGIKPFDLTTSYSGLRESALANKLMSAFSRLSNNCVYFSFRNLITSNLTRPFFYREPEMEGVIMDAMLTFLKEEREADMVTIIDRSVNDAHYRKAGFDIYPSPSEAYFDVTKYTDISEYLHQHQSLRRNLRRREGTVVTEVLQGPVSQSDQMQIGKCVICSMKLSRVNVPTQQFFGDHIFKTEVYNSDKYTHIFVRIDGRIVGFHS